MIPMPPTLMGIVIVLGIVYASVVYSLMYHGYLPQTKRGRVILLSSLIFFLIILLASILWGFYTLSLLK